MSAFGRGFRNRSPLVLVVAAVLLVPALLGFQWLFTSGAWTVVPLDAALRNPEDSFTYVSWMVGQAQQDPPATPGAVPARRLERARVDRQRRRARRRDRRARRTSRRRLRPRLDQPELRREPGRRRQRAGHAGLAARRRQPRPLHGDPSSRTPRRPRAASSCWAAGRCARSRPRSGASRSTSTRSCRASGRTSPTGRASTAAELLEGDAPSDASTQLHRYSEQTRRSDAPEEAARDDVEREPPPGLREEPGRQPADARGAAASGPASAACRSCSLELPLNEEIVGDSFDASQRQYQEPVSALAREYGAPYIDLNQTVDIPSRDFQDLSHLIAPGRVIWQHALAKELAPLLRADSGGSSG